jgi:beta-1,4-mannooligosaccharide/beta-1,4-mannosyl-N-acetylglucosamine phosphorylase
MQRSPANPILTRANIPAVPPDVDDVTSVFNPGAIRVGDRYLLLLRVQTRGRETVLMVAESADGERFTVRPHLVQFTGLDAVRQTIYHVYDPRLTRIGDTIYVMFAADTDAGCRLGVAQTRDFEHFELVGFGGDEDTRNGVLFPQQFGRRFLRLERPNRAHLAGGVASGAEIILSESADLIRWRPVGPVMAGRPHYWDELIGSGPPPVKTRAGWLHIYHGIATHFAAANIYQAGVVLLDLDDPRRVLARSRNNILEPRELYELVGQVPNVVFPSGMIVEAYDADGFARSDSLVRIYYGAADTCIGLATGRISEILNWLDTHGEGGSEHSPII